jgi:hypothetical protein
MRQLDSLRYIFARIASSAHRVEFRQPAAQRMSPSQLCLGPKRNDELAMNDG